VRLTDTFRAGFAPGGPARLSIWDFLDADQRARLGRVLEGRLLRADLALPSPVGSVAAEAEAVLDAAVMRHALLTVAPFGADAEPRSGADVLLDDPSLLDSPAIVWIKDLGGRYLRINRRYSERLGIDEANIKGKTDAELAPAHLVEDPRALHRSEQGGEPAQLEYTVDALGPRGALTVLRFPLHGLGGAAVAVCGVAASVTEAATARSEAERLLRMERWAGLSAAAIRAELIEEWQLAELADSEPVAETATALRADAPGERAGGPAAARVLASEAVTELRVAAEVAAQRTRAEAAEIEAAAQGARADHAEHELAHLRARVAELERAKTLMAGEQADTERAARSELERRVAEAQRRVEESERALAARDEDAARVRAELVARAEEAEAAIAEVRAGGERAAASVRRADAAAALARERADGLEAALTRARTAEAESRAERSWAREEGRDAASPGLTWSARSQLALTASLAAATEWRTGLRDTLRILGAEGGWEVVIAWYPDERSGKLRCVAMWMSASEHLSLFETSTWQRRQSPTASLLGRAATGAHATWVEDLGAAPDAQLASAANEGMRGSLLVPMRHGGESSGALELLTRAAGAPDAEVIAAFEAIALQLAHFEYLLRRGAEPRWGLGRL
jgi:PAS domain-containing protein